ncbi:Wzz/FepE/Etk N-terminal domain-containing protein [Aliifodinibius sp. S!AR15-10]|uniref:Wzz/FepE/Etk N-terminal domain-containing protein n=1 Tax=Aliifodinibius sp. S!AR15-10 TaxID=2950437 RepID=UPI00285A3106|nr:Wzz/FepE/Etk N-terminal domain-containing protein [Aliifodinibius sp. S!AR15-10]MDR8393500.1 Wzz/FepE/Etk N-terminal domain-containing protein [Aliifodinibius sp. S!AR15-10]
MVPVEEWEEREDDEREIDLVELAQHIWSKRLFIAKVTGVFVVIGLLVALLSPKEYQTDATLLPETPSTQSGASGLLQQYGGLLGMSGSSLNLDQEGMIPPTLYPQIVQSLPFQLELLNKKVHFAEFDTTTTVYAFFDEVYTPSVFSYVLEYTIGLPGKVIGLFKPEAPEQPLPRGFAADSVVSVTKDQMEVIENMQERVTVSLNEESGVINLNVEMPDPNAAAQVGKTSIVLLKEYMTNYRTRKAQEDLEHARQQLEEVRQRFEEAQTQLAEFRDSNVNLATAQAQTREQRLQSEYDIAFNVYNSLAQRVEQAKLKVQEQTPVVSILQPVQVPIEKSSPQRLYLILSLFFIGSITSVTYIVIKSIYRIKYDR